MIKLVVSTFFILNFLAARAYSECEFSPRNYRRTHKDEEFTLYVARETADPNDSNFNEDKCHISYEYEYYESSAADRWFECSNKMTIMESIHESSGVGKLKYERRNNAIAISVANINRINRLKLYEICL